MAETLQLEPVTIIELHHAPRLLVEWAPRWQSFTSSIGPAFSRSGPRLAGEAQHGVFPYKGMLASFALEALFVFAIAILPREIQQLRPYAPPKLKPYEVIYFSGDELPRTEDLGGAQSGASGHAGGREAYHRTQTIHLTRGGSVAPQIVDAPNLKIPVANGAVANLLAYKAAPVHPIPGAPALEGLHSSALSPRLPDNVVAPAPTVTTDSSRRMTSLNTVVPPSPELSADASRTAPPLAAQVVPPAPVVPSEHTLYLPKLDPAIIAPAPTVSRNGSRTAPGLTPHVIAPSTTSVASEQSRTAPNLQAAVVPPAPSAVGHEVAASRIRMSDVAVVPPPVSAPVRQDTRTAKLNLPAPSVIAPPPSPESERDLRHLESGGTNGNSPTVVPPPPTPAASTSFVSTVIGKLFGTQDVVPPPPSATSPGGGANSRGVGLASNVIPPPPSAAGANSNDTGRTPRNAPLAAQVIAPPPNVGASSGSSGSSRGASLAANVVPPPPAVSGSDSKSAGQGTSRSTVLLANNVVPPPPAMDTGSGSGSGRKNIGLGGPGDVGAVAAPPKAAPAKESNGSGDSGVVVSSQPGSKVGLPASGSKGSLAMSPSGGEKPGLGGSGNGESIGHGSGAGSGLTGTNSGAGKTGSGKGSDPAAHSGISPTPGPGGAGTAATGNPPVPGVDVRGGSTSVVNLPSFGSDPSNPSAPARSNVKQQAGPAITIVATSSSGGGFNFYGQLPGDNYTVYVDTNVGTVVMQFAEVDAAAHASAGQLTGPQGMRTELPAGLPHLRVVVKCRLDASGNLKTCKALEPGSPAMIAKIMAALPNWKFRPATRGVQPVEVDAILGFNIDTNDRY